MSQNDRPTAIHPGGENMAKKRTSKTHSSPTKAMELAALAEQLGWGPEIRVVRGDLDDENALRDG